MNDLESLELEFAEETLTEEVLSPLDEIDFASRLLEISGDEELDQFLGDLIKKAGGAVGSFIKSDTGRALTSILKGAAKKALPVIGKAVGGYLGGPSGARIGSQLATQAAQIFGLELEGLSPEDQEFEVARSFVRFASNAVKRAVKMPSSLPPKTVATKAVVEAARQFAPGLLSSNFSKSESIGASSGKWIRRGKSIVIINCY